jgi:hypothetical protein
MDFSGLLWILLLDIVVSGALGGAIAYCSARIQRRQTLAWWKTAVLSASAFLVGVYGANFAGFYWPSVTDAARYYGRPIYDGFALAILASVMFELYRYLESPKKPAT